MKNPNKTELYIRRCIELAQLGAGQVSPNPMVGAVLVYQDRIIGEGYHQTFGHAHAEVNAIASVQPEDKALIAQSTLYVSLEPCCIYGKTPPCTNLILEHKIPSVVIACLDHSPKVSGRGVEILRAAGVEVTVGILEKEGSILSTPSNIYQQFQRPYVILKWAQTSNGMFAPADRTQAWISNAYTRRLTHKWRMEADAILVGTTTARHDNPGLDNRFYFGKSPRPIVLDRHATLPSSLQLFQQMPAIRVTQIGTPLAHLSDSSKSIEIDFEAPDFALQFLQACAHAQIGILLVEGGAQLLHTFIQAGLWDEARVIQNTSAWIQNGISAPILPVAPKYRTTYYDDQISYYFSG